MNDPDTEYKTFAYDANGYLTEAKQRTDGSWDVYTMTYQNGNITQVKRVDAEVDTEITTFSYTNNSITTAIENKGCFMFYDEMLANDIDELQYAYWAGLLGKATKHLPLRRADNEGYSRSFSWTLNNNGYPTKLVVESEYTTLYRFLFTW